MLKQLTSRKLRASSATLTHHLTYLTYTAHHQAKQHQQHHQRKCLGGRAAEPVLRPLRGGGIDNHQSGSRHQQPNPRPSACRRHPHTLQDQHTKGRRPRRRPRIGPQRLCCRIGWSIHKYLQPLTFTVHCIYVPAKQSSITSLNDYRPVALTPVIIKCLHKLFLQHIRTALPPTLDPHQFAYRANRQRDLYDPPHRPAPPGAAGDLCTANCLWTTAVHLILSSPTDCFPRCPTWVYSSTSAFGLRTS